MFPPLTKRQKEILDYINNSIKSNGYAPSLQEIKEYFKLKAISTVHEHLENLKSKGYIKKEMNQARGIQVQQNNPSQNCLNVPIKGEVFGKEVTLYNQDSYMLAIDQKILGEVEVSIGVEIKDKSLEEYGLHNGDLLVFTEQSNANNNDLILLEDENGKFEVSKNGPIEEKNKTIRGKAVCLIKRLN